MADTCVIAYDIGTTSVKTCLFNVIEGVKLVASANTGYPMRVLENGGVEQNPDDWWEAMCKTTREVIAKSGFDARRVAGISFCSQMQGLVLVDRNGRHVRPAMSYMDQRATKQMDARMRRGIQLDGANLFVLLQALSITKAAPTSVKDPVWKYLWVKENEPENFARVYKWLDVKEALICRCTGSFAMTRDSAYATLLCDTREGGGGFSRELCKTFGVNFDHLPEVISSTDSAGGLTAEAASGLGLAEGVPVFGGGGDAAIMSVGAGATKPGSTHIYVGTSGWVSTALENQLVDVDCKIAAIVAAGKCYQYFAEMETAGKCLEWVRDHLALDEIGVYQNGQLRSDSPGEVSRSLYDYLVQSIEEAPAGSRRVLFVPWLHGNRCPFEDSLVRGAFFNIGLETGKRDMIRAVLEGICFHLRWMLESQEKKIRLSDKIRFVGGGALAPATCRILADITGKTIETVKNPQNAGATGAAVAAAVGLGILPSIEYADHIITADATYAPNSENREIYDKSYKAFKSLYKNNKRTYHLLNRI